MTTPLAPRVRYAVQNDDEAIQKGLAAVCDNVIQIGVLKIRAEAGHALVVPGPGKLFEVGPVAMLHGDAGPGRKTQKDLHVGPGHNDSLNAFRAVLQHFRDGVDAVDDLHDSGYRVSRIGRGINPPVFA